MKESSFDAVTPPRTKARKKVKNRSLG